MTAEKVNTWADDPAFVVQKMNNRMTITKLENEEDESDMSYHFQIQTPTFVVSNRSLFVTYHVQKNAETGVILIHSSSRGTEKLAESKADLVGYNVVGELLISYVRMEPISTGGYMIEQVSCFDPKGWIPDFINQIGVTKSANIVKDTVEFLLTGKEPVPLF